VIYVIPTVLPWILRDFHDISMNLGDFRDNSMNFT
jgi:hypothetical protein